MIDRGLRLRQVGTPELEWGDLRSIIRWLKPDSALSRSMHPEKPGWGQSEHILADLVDLTNIVVWFKTKDGAKNRNRPKPYPRPGVEDDSKRIVKGTARELPEAKKLFAVPRT